MGVGFRARVLSFARTVRTGGRHIAEAKVDPDGGSIVTLEVVAPPGDDSPPIAEDYAVGVAVPGRGRAVAVGFADTRNAGQAEPGEKRFVGRTASGAIRCTVWLRGDGSVTLENDAGSVQLASDGAVSARNSLGRFELDAAGKLSASVLEIELGNGAGALTLDQSGTWTINGVQITPAGDVISALGKSLNLHAHMQGDDSAGDTQQPTGPAQ